MHFLSSLASSSSSSLVGIDRAFSSATYDSRKAGKGILFIATQGKARDGHDFVLDAIKNGSESFLVEGRRPDIISLINAKGLSAVVSDSSINALYSYVRKRNASMGAVIVGITGSCGKTTTKEMVASILSEGGKVSYTPLNQNSDYGLPLSMLPLDEGTDYGVYEFGVDHIGEMERMRSLAKVDYAAITNIGISHLGNFGTRDAIAREKGKILSGAKMGFVPTSEGYLSYFKTIANIEGVNNPFSDIEDLALGGISMRLGSEKIHMSLVGMHNVLDASIAVALTRHLGASDKDIAIGLEKLRPLSGRGKIVKEGKVTVIEDCYNATYDSVADAIDTIDRIKWDGNKNIVLGDMRELGSESKKAHERLGERLAAATASNIYLYGEEMAETSRVLSSYGRDAFHTTDFHALSSEVEKNSEGGDLFLLKGSRVMAMERLYPCLRNVV